MKNKMMSVLLLLTLLCMLSGCTIVEANNTNDDLEAVTIMEEQYDDMEPIVTEEPVYVPEITNVKLMAVGDNLYHSTVYKKGANEEGYDFDFVYEHLADFICEYDIAVVNQETPLVTENYSSYPTFGTPIEAGKALINSGFNVILNATNHTYDKGYDGVQSTIGLYKNYPDITYLGIHENEDDFNTVKIIEVNDIRIAMMNYTYGLNGFIVPDKYHYLVDTLYDEEKIKADLMYAEENADITIVFPHWGNEYVYNETDAQKRLAQLFTEYGADIIIGSHPHVCEPVKYIRTENGNESLCYYSLGNFVSGQDEKPRILGGIASLQIVKTDGAIEIIEPTFIPCVTYRTPTDIGVYLLKDYTDEMVEPTSLKATPEYLWKLWYDINEPTEIEFEVGIPMVEAN